MGLSGPKNKRKLGNDPNNTKWSRNTDNFGHRMLRSQGWEPGQYLGPQGAAHAVFHTAASASHIKVALKEDNLGLGAKMARGDECTGLSAFKEMLARLNGKSEAAIEKDKSARETHARNVYIERKFGTMRFVSGGFLVGDVIKDSTADKSDSDTTTTAESATEKPGKEKKEKKDKKRKADVVDEDADQSKGEKRSSKKHKKHRKDAETSGDADEADNDTADEDSVRAKRKKEKESKRKDKERKREEQGSAEDSEDEAARKKRRKQEKKEKKELKKEKRDKKSREKEAATASSDLEDSSAEASESPASSTPATGASTPVESGTSTPVSRVSVRHLARRRFIASKRMGIKDQQALNQIFMIKSS